jgi:glyoxylase-like metal-dependent hydrolase (beta-lactamase superfamily II)
METSMNRLPALALVALMAAPALAGTPPPVNLPDLEYLKVINEAGPGDPQLVFLLSSQYANANRLDEGISVFEGMLRNFGPRLQPAQRALYLTALASLRAQHAKDVSMLRRIGWVKDTLSLLDEANTITRGQVFVVRWMSGVVRAQLPAILGERDRARQDLQWCEQHASAFPHPGWLREVYFQLGSLKRADGDEAAAARYLAQSGYPGWDKPVTLTTPFAVDAHNGHTFGAKAVREIVRGKVFALSGFEFTEYYFIVSDDGKELISIDAGARSDSARQAYEALKQRVPNLPPLTTVFVTHAHWDHVGGAHFFRTLSPNVKFYGRGNYAAEQSRETGAPNTYETRFFGQGYDGKTMHEYKPDVAVNATTELRVGGTRFELIPASGGETEDAMMIYMPDERAMFVGDIVMPYIGAPFVEEGNLDGMFQAVDLIAQKNPKFLLHGHEALTRTFDSPALLLQVRAQLAWLRDRVVEAIAQGQERAQIQQRNLMPPGIIRNSPRAQLAYLVLRENTINRIYDQHVGYWQPDLQGMDSVTMADRGVMLIDYLGLDEHKLADAAQRMIADGRHEQAAQLVQWARARGPIGPELDKAGRLANAKLAERVQEFNPFKFIIYTGEARLEVQRVQAPAPSSSASSP